MILWLDAQLPPALASWIRTEFAIPAHAVRDLGLRDATDEQIFLAARNANAVVVTKDSDFVTLLERHSQPPRIIWLTLGNCSNDALKKVFARHWPTVHALLRQGESLIEISGQQ